MPISNAWFARSKRLNGMVLGKAQLYGEHGVGWCRHAYARDINGNQCVYLGTALQQISGDYGGWATEVKRKSFMKNTLILLIAAVVCGCATKINPTLTVYSQPPGAFITEVDSSRAIGTAPVVIPYNGEALKNFQDSSGCFKVAGLKAQWVSGATSNSAQTIQLCGPIGGDYTYQFSRDQNFPDLEKDLEFSMRQQAVKAQQFQQLLQLQQQQQSQQLMQQQQQQQQQQQIQNILLKQSVQPATILAPAQINCTTSYDSFFKEYTTNCK